MVHKTGLPHSEIHGSKGARPSPQLFAACHVLHRLLAPRHPPDALFNASFHSCFTHAQKTNQMSEFGKTENRDRMIPVTSSGSNRLASSSEQSVVLDQCRIHMSPKLPPTTRSIALACNKTLDRSQCFRIKTNPAIGELRITLSARSDRSSVAGTTIARPRQASIAHANPPPQCQ